MHPHRDRVQTEAPRKPSVNRLPAISLGALTRAFGHRSEEASRASFVGEEPPVAFRYLGHVDKALGIFLQVGDPARISAGPVFGRGGGILLSQGGVGSVLGVEFRIGLLPLNDVVFGSMTGAD